MTFLRFRRAARSFPAAALLCVAVALCATTGCSQKLPNALSPILVEATFGIARAILAEAGLSFLGLGVAPPSPSWGSMIGDGRHFLFVAPHMVISPGIAILLTVMAFNFVGDGLRDAQDIRE